MPPFFQFPEPVRDIGPIGPVADVSKLQSREPEWSTLTSQAIGLMRDLGTPKEKSKEPSWAEILEALRGYNRAQLSSAKNSSVRKTSYDDYFARNRKFESANDPNAVNKGSGASGLYQFLPSTWRDIMKNAPELGLTEEGILNEDQQNKAMRYYTDRSARILRTVLGRDPSGGELYLLHVLGQSGGPKVLSNLDAPLSQTVAGPSLAGNPFLNRYKTGRDLIAGLNTQFGG